MKAAGHELKGLSALHRVASEARDERDAKALAESTAAVTKEVCGLGSLRTPLMVVVDYRGWRIVAMSVVPIGDGTLCYGSDDQARTVHRDPTVAAMMEDAGTVLERRFTRNIRCNASCAYVVVAAGARLNLKPHMVGTRGSQLTSIIGPCDIEVHRGSDGHLYVVEAPCRTTYPYSLRRADTYHVAVWLCGCVAAAIPWTLPVCSRLRRPRSTCALCCCHPMPTIRQWITTSPSHRGVRAFQRSWRARATAELPGRCSL